MKTGIDAIAFDVAKIHLPITVLAEARNIETEKLVNGLGIVKMTFPDFHQDAIVFAANALTKLIDQNKIDLRSVDKIYVGTESSVDSSKPISSYLVSMMEQKYGEGLLSECDVVDFTFACIGAVDALQAGLNHIRMNTKKKAIIISTDFAKYDLNSTGEYTQGAGAVAMLISALPSIISFPSHTGISTKGAFDFFKPYRTISKQEITGNDKNTPWFNNLEDVIEIHKDQPVFDGQYSNQCYMDRIKDAYYSFKKANHIDFFEPICTKWEAIIMHLPYAYQGRRMFTEIFALDSNIDLPYIDSPEYRVKLKEIGWSENYNSFVKSKLAPAETASSFIGNLYTGSIFMGLISTLVHFYEYRQEIASKKFGFFAYGSGSKAKVFEGFIMPKWKLAISRIFLFETLNKSTEIDLETYERLHRKEQKTSVVEPHNEWVLERIEKENPNLLGARYYKWID